MFLRDNDMLTLPPHTQEYLNARGIDDETAKKIGFYYTNNFDFTTQQTISGLAIPYFNSKGEKIGERIRILDEDWQTNYNLKSKFDPNDLPKYLTKKGQKNIPYLPPIIPWKKVCHKTSQDIIITEGEIKATLACLHGINCIGLAGVWTFKTKIDEFRSTFLPELENINWQGRNVGICFDSDIVNNQQIKLAAQQLATELLNRKANPYLIIIPQELNETKNGLDDFIMRHGIDAFKQLIRAFKTYQKSEDSKKIIQIHARRDFDSLTKEAQIKTLEPHSQIKALMNWSILKQNWEYKKGVGWYHWDGHIWQAPMDDKGGEDCLLSQIREFRVAQNWLNNTDNQCLEEFKKLKISNGKLEQQWNNSQYLAFKNGYLNCQTGEFTPPIKEGMVTSFLPFDYQENTSCNQWFKWLEFTFGGDYNKIQYLRAWMRWILQPKEDKDYSIEATLWVIGKPRTGKSTFFSVLMGLVGKQNIGMFQPNDIQNENKLYGLYNKKLAINTDVDAFINDIPLYNRICSNEYVPLKNLYHNCFTDRLNTVTVLGMNQELTFKGGGSEGLQRRLHVIRFEKKPEHIDTELKEKLLSELPAIFAWVWQLSLTDTKQILNWRILDDVKQVYESNHPEIDFLRQEYAEGRKIKASVIYEDYSDWCKNNGYKSCSLTNFGRLISKIQGVSKEKTRDGIYYDIPQVKNYFDFDSQQDISNLTNVNSLPFVNSCEHPSVNSSNPVTEQGVHSVNTSAQDFLENQNNFSENKKSLPKNYSQPCTPTSQQQLEVCTPEESLKFYRCIINNLGVDYVKDFSDTEFNVIYHDFWQNHMNESELRLIREIRKQSKSKPKSPPPPKLTPKNQTPKQQQRTYTPRPQAPEVNLSDVLPHLEQGKGKHKRNYVCPCCNKDYLSINKNGKFKCWNPNDHCDTKQIYKEFIEILKSNDLKWQRYQQDLEDWENNRN